MKKMNTLYLGCFFILFSCMSCAGGEAIFDITTNRGVSSEHVSNEVKADKLGTYSSDCEELSVEYLTGFQKTGADSLLEIKATIETPIQTVTYLRYVDVTRMYNNCLSRDTDGEGFCVIFAIYGNKEGEFTTMSSIVSHERKGDDGKIAYTSLTNVEDSESWTEYDIFFDDGCKQRSSFGSSGHLIERINSKAKERNSEIMSGITNPSEKVVGISVGVLPKEQSALNLKQDLIDENKGTFIISATARLCKLKKVKNLAIADSKMNQVGDISETSF